MSVLVTGAAGALGSMHLAAQPTEAPWPVVRGANIDGGYELESSRDMATWLSPQDFADLPAGPFGHRVGGPFTGADFGIDETAAAILR